MAAARTVQADCPSEIVLALVDEHNKAVDAIAELKEAWGGVTGPMPRKINLVEPTKEP